MSLSKDDIIELMNKAKEMGLSSIKTPDFEANFGNAAIIQYQADPQPDNEDEKFEDILKPASPYDELSEEEILYWGTSYGEELIRKRLAREEEIKQETRALGRNRSNTSGASDGKESTTLKHAANRL